jgi:hypothetical protein
VNLDDTVSNVLEERLRFVKHKGQAIFLIDFTHCMAKEILVLLEQVKAMVSRHAPNSMLVLTDFTGAEVDKKTLTRMKEVAALDRPYVKRSAAVGADSMPHVFLENVKSFSHREIPTFNTREEAMDWLVAE